MATVERHRLVALAELHPAALDVVWREPVELRVDARAVVALGVVLGDELPVRRDVVDLAVATPQRGEIEALDVRHEVAEPCFQRRSARVARAEHEPLPDGLPVALGRVGAVLDPPDAHPVAGEPLALLERVDVGVPVRTARQQRRAEERPRDRVQLLVRQRPGRLDGIGTEAHVDGPVRDRDVDRPQAEAGGVEVLEALDVLRARKPAVEVIDPRVVRALEPNQRAARFRDQLRPAVQAHVVERSNHPVPPPDHDGRLAANRRKRVRARCRDEGFLDGRRPAFTDPALGNVGHAIGSSFRGSMGGT
jgi:hypothetical protein